MKNLYIKSRNFLAFEGKRQNQEMRCNLRLDNDSNNSDKTCYDFP